LDTLIGTSIGGYTLIKLLGVGGMGSVYLASDAAIDQQVAVKIIRTDMDSYTDSTSAQMALERFRQEARAVAHLDHLHILPLYRYGEEETPQGPRAYMIMQYRPEGSLWDWLRRRADIAAGNLQPTQAELSFGLPVHWPLGLEEVADYLQQAASSLQYAHDRGIVHRDVKPANFLLRIDLHDKSVHLMLSDFGLAKVFTSSSATNTILGTPTYMAPEQFEGAARPESDQYALAVMIYYMLAGRAPFEGDPMQLMRQHLSSEVPSITAFNPNIPSYINGIFARAMAKQPEQRFSSVTAFAEAFSSAAKGQPSTLSPLSMSGTIAPTPGRSGLLSAGPLVLPGAPDPAAAGIGMYNNAQTMYPTPSPTAYPTPVPTGSVYGAQGLFTSPPHIYGQQTVNPAQRSMSGYPQAGTGRGEEKVSRRSALGCILGGAAVVVAGAGVGIYSYAKSNTPSGTPTVTSPAVSGGPNSSGGSSNLPPHASAILTGHTAAVTSLSWLSDGTQLASGSLDSTARLWTSSGSAGQVINATSVVHSLAWSPDGSTLATGEDDKSVELWSASGSPIKREVGWGAVITALAWRDDDRVLFVGTYGNSIHTLDIANGKHSGKNSPSHVTSISLSPDGRYLAVALTSGLVYFAELSKNLGEAAMLPFVHGVAYSVAWSPDGSMVAVGYEDHNAIVYNASTRKALYTLTHGSPVYSVAWSPNSTTPILASGSGDKTVRIWNLDGSPNPAIYTGHTDAVLAVSWSANLLASASKDKSIILWKPLTS